jgi:hypothetical protein
MPVLTDLPCVRSRNPERILIIQPSVGGASRTGEERLRWVNIANNFSTLKELNRHSGPSIKLFQSFDFYWTVTRRSSFLATPGRWIKSLRDIEIRRRHSRDIFAVRIPDRIKVFADSRRRAKSGR